MSAGVFFEDVDGVEGEILEALDEATGLADLRPVDFRCGAEAQMNAPRVRIGTGGLNVK